MNINSLYHEEHSTLDSICSQHNYIHGVVSNLLSYIVALYKSHYLLVLVSTPYIFHRFAFFGIRLKRIFLALD